ncbi:MAG: hypothetical protein KIT11_06170 [Fimbriimonadaceae bacterium]|nr:hypothetical protein [Fimbriimonadaceae bacterium]QYK55943.1 MAG: hypothetical protein KF733_00360 [Fimbriimonadaceae bacterium]
MVVVATLGLVKGQEAIRDPGQTREQVNLSLLYIVGALVMAVHGLISHRQAVQAYDEALED